MILVLFILSVAFYNISYYLSVLEEDVDLPYPIVHYYKTNSTFYIIDRIFFERDYSFDLKVEFAQPINGEVEIDSYAFGERERDNANFIWIKPLYKNGFYNIDGVLPKREIYIKLKITTNENQGTGIGYLSFKHLFKTYHLKIVLGTTKECFFDEYPFEYIPYITGYNYEYGIATDELIKNGGVHPYLPKIKSYAKSLLKENSFETAKNILNFVMNIFSQGINVTYLGDYPDYYYIDRYEKEGSISGVCSERSILFLSLIRSIGIPSRLVYASGYPVDHVFVECFIDGEWINFDSTYGIIGKKDFYYEKIVRNLSTFSNFYGGVREHFKKYRDIINPIYPYEEILNDIYLKESIVINGVGGVKIGDSYFLSLKIRWALFNYKDKELFLTIIDSLGNKKVAEIETKNLFYNFAEGTISIKMKLNDFLEINGKRQFKINVKLIDKEKLLDYYEISEGLFLENFSF
ncbi:MAG TPA: transglutaminase domain-containing protein [Caldisericia bacterium]|nr:transglutaminase domain-containing protein [Caldisericia bacterium]